MKRLLLLLLLPFLAHGADYYASHAGAGLEDGSSADNAWAWDGITWASMGAGDTLNLLDILRVTTQMTIGSEGTGTGANRFTIDGGDVGGVLYSGSGNEFSGGWSGPDAYGAYSQSGSGTIVSALEWTSDPLTGTVLDNMDKVPDGDWTSETGVFHHDYDGDGTFYYKPTSGTPTGKTVNQIANSAVTCDNKDYVKLVDVHIIGRLDLGRSAASPCHYFWLDSSVVRGAGHGEEVCIHIGEYTGVTGSDNGRISNSEIKTCADGIYVYNQVYGSNANNHDSWQIDGNEIHDIQRTQDAHGIGIQGGENWIVEYNNIYDTGSGIVFWSSGAGDGQHTISSNTVRYNWIHDTNGTGTNEFMHAIEFSCGNSVQGYCLSNLVYGNLIENIEDAGIRVKWSSNTNKILNNTIVNAGSDETGPQGAHIAFQTNLRTSNGHAGVVKNNLSLDPEQWHVYIASQTGGYAGLDFDYNLYDPGTGSLWYYAPDAAAETLANWKLEAFSPDANAQSGTSGLEGSAPYANFTDFRLTDGSNAIDNGEDLGNSLSYGLSPTDTAWPPTAVDMDSYGTGWEIGAFAYESMGGLLLLIGP